MHGFAGLVRRYLLWALFGATHIIPVLFVAIPKGSVPSIYVDDIIITSNDAPGIIQVKRDLGLSFEIKDLGPLRYFLGIEVARSRQRITLSQRKYALDLLQDTGILGCRPASSPMYLNLKLSV